MALPHVRREADVEDSLDAAIASLRQSVEREAIRHKSPDNEDPARSAERSSYGIDSPAWAATDRTARPPLGLPTVLLLVVGGIRRFVRRHRFDIVFYGLCIGVTIAVTLIVVGVSMGEP
jgi:hypothetical protein